MGITAEIRTALKLRTIGAIDKPAEQRAAERREQQRSCQRTETPRAAYPNPRRGPRRPAPGNSRGSKREFPLHVVSASPAGSRLTYAVAGRVPSARSQRDGTYPTQSSFTKSTIKRWRRSPSATQMQMHVVGSNPPSRVRHPTATVYSILLHCSRAVSHRCSRVFSRQKKIRIKTVSLSPVRPPHLRGVTARQFCPRLVWASLRNRDPTPSFRSQGDTVSPMLVDIADGLWLSVNATRDRARFPTRARLSHF